VQVLNAKGVVLSIFGQAGTLPGQFKEIVDVAVDALDNIYVVDRAMTGSQSTPAEESWCGSKRGS